MRLRQAIASTLILSVFSACAGRQVQEESYTPSQEVLQLKSGMQVTELWDRWEERGDRRLLVDGKHVIHREELASLLSDTPSVEALEKVHAYQEWRKASQTASIVALLAGSLALIGYIKNDHGGRTFSESITNTFWGITAASAGFSFAAYRISEAKLTNAIPLHNSAAGAREQAFQLQWEGKF